MNSISDTLYGVYSNEQEQWDAFDQKYKSEDAGTKKFLVSCVFEFKMVDNIQSMKQVTHLHLLLHCIHVERMDLTEAFQVACIIQKLPSMWSIINDYLKHKQKEVTMVDLLGRIIRQEKYMNDAR